MNQSMGANTLEKSSFGSDWQDESANELWKGTYVRPITYIRDRTCIGRKV